MEPIAITGIACRFPGAPDPACYWKLLSEGREAIRNMPADRLALWEALGESRASAPRAGYLDTIDEFEPELFGLSPREASRMDPQQRLLLELTWEALEDANEVPSRLAESNCGVFVGIMNADHALVHGQALSMMDAHLGIGSSLGIAANRISYTFDLRGPSIAIDTLCSSSLVAVHLACQALASDPSMPLAVAGGVNVMSFPAMHLFYADAGLLSPDARCRAFDASANGIVRGEGGGLVVLKRLADARANGDLVYAVIRGSAVNQDGKSNGLTAPNRFAQERVLAEAYRRADVSPGDVQLIEAHGTGTLVGDPIELKALGAVLGRGRRPQARCAVGSVKSNFGHLESAAGAAALIKTALCIYHRKICPSLHFSSPNPYLRGADLPLRVVTAPESWPDGASLPLAGVSSFGLGGTNAHIVLEGAGSASSAAGPTRSLHVLPISARTPESLRALAGSYRELLAERDLCLDDVVSATAHCRTHHAVRLAIVASDAAGLSAGLQRFLEGVPSVGVHVGRQETRAAPPADVPRSGTDAARMEQAAASFVRGSRVDFVGLGLATTARARLPIYPFYRRHFSTDISSVLQSRRVAPATVEAAIYEITWKRSAPGAAAARGAVLIVGDVEGVGSAAAKRLATEGRHCVLVTSVDANRLLGPDLESWSALIAEAQKGLGAPFLDIVHCLSLDAPRVSSDVDLDESDRLGYRSVLSLLKAAPSARVWVAARGAFAVVAADDPSLAHAALVGLAKVARVERGELWGALVDLDPSAVVDDDARVLVATVSGDAAEPEVAWRNGTMWVPRLAPRSSEGAASFSLRADATYLVTGGFGGLGLAVAGWLVTRGARHLALLGRRGRTVESSQAMSDLEAQGVSIRAYAVDVADEQQLARALEDLDRSQPPLRGVIHAAGVLDDKLLHRQSWDDFVRVSAPKSRGAFHLHRLLASRPLDFFVLFSSVASVLGSPGQANYAAANAFLDALGRHRASRKLPATVINWGPWADAGMAAHIEQRVGARGFSLLSPDDALRALGRVMADRIPASTVARVNWTRLFEDSPAASSLPILSDLRPKSAPRERATVRSVLLSGGGPERRNEIIAFLREQLAATLNLAVGDVPDDLPMDRLGLDSMLGLELKERIEQNLGTTISIASFFDATVAQVADKLVEAPNAPTSLPASATREAPRAAATTLLHVADAAKVPGASPWLVPIRADPHARIRLVCFPYAGGAAHVYRSWSEGLGDGVDVWAVELPGRGARRNEPPMTRVADIVDKLLPSLVALLDRPFAFFGHCLGAVVMFEAARRIARELGRSPRELFVSGAPAPQLYLIPQVYGRSDERFREVLELIHFASSEPLFRDPELLRRALPTVRADFEAASSYRFEPRPDDDGVLDVPITAFGAWEDVFAPQAAIEPWRERTRAGFSMFMRPGEHYFVETERTFLHEAIAERLQADAPQKKAQGICRLVLPLSRPRAKQRLICFPHAGGDLSTFEPWARSLPDDIEVVCVELPRNHAGLPEVPRIDALASLVATALSPWLDRPFAFFGHDLGALLMMETTHRLRSAGRPLPDHLFVSAAMAPHLNFFPPVHLFASTRLRDLVRFFGLDFQQDEELLRRDFELIANHRTPGPVAVDIPITAFAAWEDTLVPYAGVEGWRAHTAATFELLRREGDHDGWRRDPQRAAMLDEIAARLLGKSGS